jgi:predicted CopG family antitoxin
MTTQLESSERKEPKRRRSISVSEYTFQELQKFGRYGDSVGDVINRMIESHKKVIAAGT